MKKALFFILITSIFSLKAQLFEPPVIIDPPHPMVGDTIRVGLFTTFYPPCLSLPAYNFQNISHLFEFSGNNIRLTAVNDTFSIPICNPFPVSPAPRAYYELGTLPEGKYNLETLIGGTTVPLPIPITNPPTFFPLIYGPIITFSVTKPIVVNTLSMNSAILYVLLVLTITNLGWSYFLRIKTNPRS